MKRITSLPNQRRPSGRLTMTLAEILAITGKRPWMPSLLAHCGGPATPLETAVSLGDVAAACGTDVALLCVRNRGWSHIAVRRAMIGALLPMLRRAASHMPDERVDACIDALARWSSGTVVDLLATEEMARTARDQAPREAKEGAAAVAHVAWAARETRAELVATLLMFATHDAASMAASVAAKAAVAAAPIWVTAAAAARAEAGWAEAAEHKLQVRDFIAAFRPIHRSSMPTL